MPEEPVYSFSPNGKHIAAGLSDCTVQLQNIETGELDGASKPLFVHKEAYKNKIHSITFSADGKYIIICSEYGIRLCQWKSETREVTLLSQADPGVILATAISPDNKYIIVASYDIIQLYTIETDRSNLLLVSRLGGYRDRVNSVSDGKYIASGSGDRTIRIYHNNLADRTCHDSDFRRAQTTFLHHYPIGSVVMGLINSDEGWLQYPSGELLLWVRPDLHLGLYFPSVVHVIGADSIKIELSKFVHGTE